MLLGLGVWALLDPYANIPGISQIVCSLKGASWRDGSSVLDVPPGCYGRSVSTDGVDAVGSLLDGDDGGLEGAVGPAWALRSLMLGRMITDEGEAR